MPRLPFNEAQIQAVQENDFPAFAATLPTGTTHNEALELYTEARHTWADPLVTHFAEQWGLNEAPIIDGSFYVLWCKHPKRGYLYKESRDTGYYHEQWFETLKLPTTGAAFDAIPRGRFCIEPESKQTDEFLHGPNTTPDEVKRYMRNKYDLKGYENMVIHMGTGSTRNADRGSDMPTIWEAAGATAVKKLPYTLMWAQDPKTKEFLYKRTGHGPYDSSDFMEHYEWFRHIGLPFTGEGFDKILRGRFFFDTPNKEVRELLYSPTGEHIQTPDEVLRHVRGLFPQIKGWKHVQKDFMERDRINKTSIWEQFIKENENNSEWQSLRPGENVAYVFDGKEDSAKVYRRRDGKFVLDNGDYDKVGTAVEIDAYLKANGYKYVGVDDIDESIINEIGDQEKANLDTNHPKPGDSVPDDPASKQQQLYLKKKKRDAEKLLPGESDNVEDAKKAGKRLGLQGFHTTGVYKYKPGSSEDAYRDAIARRKEQNQFNEAATVQRPGSWGIIGKYFDAHPDLIDILKSSASGAPFTTEFQKDPIEIARQLIWVWTNYVTSGTPQLDDMRPKFAYMLRSGKLNKFHPLAGSSKKEITVYRVSTGRKHPNEVTSWSKTPHAWADIMDGSPSRTLKITKDVLALDVDKIYPTISKEPGYRASSDVKEVLVLEPMNESLWGKFNESTVDNSLDYKTWNFGFLDKNGIQVIPKKQPVSTFHSDIARALGFEDTEQALVQGKLIRFDILLTGRGIFEYSVKNPDAKNAIKRYLDKHRPWEVTVQPFDSSTALEFGELPLAQALEKLNESSESDALASKWLEAQKNYDASFGFIDKYGNIIVPKKSILGNNSHTLIAKALGYSDEGDAMKRGGLIRYLNNVNDITFEYSVRHLQDSKAAIKRYLDKHPVEMVSVYPFDSAKAFEINRTSASNALHALTEEDTRLDLLKHEGFGFINKYGKFVKPEGRLISEPEHADIAKALGYQGTYDAIGDGLIRFHAHGTEVTFEYSSKHLADAKLGVKRYLDSHPNVQYVAMYPADSASAFTIRSTELTNALNALTEELVELPHNLGITRDKMPQITNEYLPDFLGWLKNQGIALSMEQITANTLKPTQTEVNTDLSSKISTTMVKSGKPLLVSSDNYILDGHNRWYAFAKSEPNDKLAAIRIHLGIKPLLSISMKYPHTQTYSINDTARHSKAPLDQSALAKVMAESLERIATLFESLDGVSLAPDGAIDAGRKTLMPFSLWSDTTTEENDDVLKLPKLEVGDKLYVGKFKNRLATIQGFDTDKNGQPIAKTDKGDQQIFKGRIEKLMSEENTVFKQFNEAYEALDENFITDKLEAFKTWVTALQREDIIRISKDLKDVPRRYHAQLKIIAANKYVEPVLNKLSGPLKSIYQIMDTLNVYGINDLTDVTPYQHYGVTVTAIIGVILLGYFIFKIWDNRSQGM